MWLPLVFVLLGPPANPGGKSEVSIDVFPKVAMAPAYGRTTVRVRWTIERHPWNEAYIVQWVSDMESGSTEKSLDGENEARVYTRFLDLPSGNYLFRVCVMREKNYCASTRLHIR